MSLSAYRYVLWQPAFEFWRSLPEKEQDRLQTHFEWLATHPHHEGFLRDVDSTGRTVFLASCGDYVVTHWPDHSVKLVQIEDVISA